MLTFDGASSDRFLGGPGGGGGRIESYSIPTPQLCRIGACLQPDGAGFFVSQELGKARRAAL
ncbi:MAG TPA: hypothetical protein GXX39_03985 [Syntrophothermus lipocalidus]|nr:hypothetical protein [Syntrophothermus lipocalidus]